MTSSARLELVDEFGRRRGSLSIECLPDYESWNGIETLTVAGVADDTSGASIQLLEEVSYRYDVGLEGAIRTETLEPRELFSHDPAGLATGRLRAGRATGTVRPTVTTSEGERFTCEFEVRSRKLNYETEYRRMMARLADEAAEIVQSSFAPSSFGGFDPDLIDDARTLYQRFAFIQALLDSEPFAEAV